ncbi:MAG: NAD(P)-dependent oxidoreductase [Deltaproteobacteria bacterium]|nr:NAD(P)-dependent oxidoreductase [Deltaproteobacteria bacterium]
MRVAVTGGSGFIGSHVVDLLLEAGHEVSCLILPSDGPGWLRDRPIALHEGSVLRPDSLDPFLEGCDGIVHLAGLTRARTQQEYDAVNTQGTVAVIEAALRSSRPPQHIVAMSSLAAMGPSAPDGSGLDEDAEFHPVTPYGRSKAALETCVRSFSDRIACTFIRAPGVYGPRDKDFLAYFRLINQGFRLVAGAHHRLSLVYVRTLARSIVSCLMNPNAYGQAFFIADEGACDWDRFATYIEAALGRSTLRIHVPDWMIGIVGTGSRIVSPLFPRPPLLSPGKFEEMRQPCWVVSTAKAERLLGFKAATSTADAIRETAAWYLEQGWI